MGPNLRKVINQMINIFCIQHCKTALW